MSSKFFGKYFEKAIRLSAGSRLTTAAGVPKPVPTYSIPTIVHRWITEWDNLPSIYSMISASRQRPFVVQIPVATGKCQNKKLTSDEMCARLTEKF